MFCERCFSALMDPVSVLLHVKTLPSSVDIMHYSLEGNMGPLNHLNFCVTMSEISHFSFDGKEKNPKLTI